MLSLFFVCIDTSIAFVNLCTMTVRNNDYYYYASSMQPSSNQYTKPMPYYLTKAS